MPPINEPGGAGDFGRGGWPFRSDRGAEEDVAEGVVRLKRQDGNDILVFGSGELAARRNGETFAQPRATGAHRDYQPTGRY